MIRSPLLAVAFALSIILSHAPPVGPVATAAPKKAKDAKKKQKKKPANNNKKKSALRFSKGDWRQVAHPLFAAAYDNDVAKAVALLRKDKKSANAKLGGKYTDASKTRGLIGGTPLTFAAWKGRDRVSAMLIKAGADVNAKDNAGLTPLHWAAQYRFHKVVSQLVIAGARVNVKDKAGKTPIDLTADDKIKAYLRKAAEKKP